MVFDPVGEFDPCVSPFILESSKLSSDGRRVRTIVADLESDVVQRSEQVRAPPSPNFPNTSVKSSAVGKLPRESGPSSFG